MRMLRTYNVFVGGDVKRPRTSQTNACGQNLSHLGRRIFTARLGRHVTLSLSRKEKTTAATTWQMKMKHFHFPRLESWQQQAHHQPANQPAMANCALTDRHSTFICFAAGRPVVGAGVEKITKTNNIFFLFFLLLNSIFTNVS